MALETSFIRRVVLLSAFASAAMMTMPAAAQVPSPALLIACWGNGAGSLQIADPAMMKVVVSVPLGSLRPHGIAVSPNGKVAYVTLGDVAMGQRAGASDEIPEDYISVIDLVARKELRRVVIGPGSWPFSIVLVRGKLYYTAEGYGLVGRYDPVRNQIDQMIGTGQIRSHSLAVSKDGEHIFIANGYSDNVSTIGLWDVPASQRVPGLAHLDTDLIPRWFASTIPVGHEPEGIALSPDDKEAWVLGRGDGSLSIIDVATNKILRTLDLKMKEPFRLAFSADGKRVLIVSHRDTNVLMFDAVARKEIKRIHIGSEIVYQGIIAPDGSHAFVSVVGDDRVAVIDMNTLEVTGSISTSAQPAAMAWAASDRM
jgi:YVTN family beta-propeller protein